MARNKVYNYLRPGCLAVVILILFWLVVSCREKLALPGVEVAVSFSDKNLSDNLLTSLKIKFITTSDFKLPVQDYELLAEASAGEKTLLREKLSFPVPVSRWQPNRVYEVQKFIYFPPFIDFFSRSVGQGLPVNFRLYFKSPLSSDMIVVYQRRLKFSPCPPDVPDVVFLNGWLVVKRPGKNPDELQVERWTGQQASCWLENPERPAMLMLRGSIPSETPPGQKVVIALGNRILEEFEPLPGSLEKIYQLTGSDFGQNDGLQLTIRVNKTIKLTDIYPDIKNEQPVGFRLETIYFR